MGLLFLDGNILYYYLKVLEFIYFVSEWDYYVKPK